MDRASVDRCPTGKGAARVDAKATGADILNSFAVYLISWIRWHD